MSHENPDSSQSSYIETLNCFFERVGSWSFDHRWVVLFSCFSVFGLSIFLATKAHIDLTFQAFFDEADPTFNAFLQYRKDFGSDEIAYILYEAPKAEYGPFNIEVMRKIVSLTEALENEVPFAKKVTSLTNVEYSESIPDGIDVYPLLEDFPETQEELLAIRDKVLAKPMLVGGLVSADAKYGAIIVDMERSSIDSPTELQYDPNGGPGLENLFPQVTDSAIEAILKRPEYSGIVFYNSGDVPWNAAYNRIMIPETMKMTLLSYLLIGSMLFIIFRNLRSVFGPFAIVTFALVFATGFVGLLDWNIDLMFSLLPALMLSVGVADSVHIISEFRRHFVELGDRRQAVCKTMRLVGTPCLLTSTTTAAGLASMSISHIQSMANLAVYSAVGVMMAFVFTITLLMTFFTFGSTELWQQASSGRATSRLRWWCTRFGVPIALVGLLVAALRKPDAAAALGLWLAEERWKIVLVGSVLATTLLFQKYAEKVLAWITHLDLRHPRKIVAFFLLLFIMSFYGMSKLRVDTYFMDEWRDGTPMKEITLKADSIMGGMSSVIYLFDTGKPEGIKDPAVLREIERVQKLAETHSDFVKKSYSIVDVIKDLNQTFHEGDPAYYRIPETRELVAQLILLYEMQGGEDLGDYVSGDLSRANLELRCRMAPISHMQKLIDQIDADLLHAPLQHTKASITGMGALWVQFAQYITTSQIEGVLLAFAVIALMMCFMFRSFTIGLLSMVPNLSPIFLTLGYMGWHGMELDYTRLLIAPLAIGIAVDDTIHLIARYHAEFQHCRNYARALNLSMSEVGNSIVNTTLILVIGFLVNVFHGMETQVMFGQLVASTLFIALVADLFFTPALILILKPFGAELPGLEAAQGGTHAGHSATNQENGN